MILPENPQVQESPFQIETLDKISFFKRITNSPRIKSILISLSILTIGFIGVLAYLNISGKISIISFARESANFVPSTLNQQKKESALTRFLNSRKNAASTSINTPTPKPTQKIQINLSIPAPTVTITPTISPTLPMNPTSSPNPPTMQISYPSEGQYIELTTSQTLCIVDVPVGTNTQGLLKRKNINNVGWGSYQAPDGTCFDPYEGQNTFSFQYKNSKGEESIVYIRTFTFHRIKKVTISFSGQLYRDGNCNNTQDSNEGNVNATTTVNIFKMPEFYIYDTISTNSSGLFTYSTSIDEVDSLSLQGGPISPEGYKSNPNYSSQTITFTKSNAKAHIVIPQVPNENISACSSK